MKKTVSLIVLLLSLLNVFAVRTKIKDHITEVRLGKYDEQELGSSKVYINKIFSNALENEHVDIVLNPRKGTTNLQYKRVGMKERLILDADARKTLSDAYDKYFSDYSSKSLKRSKKFVGEYGVARTKVEWGAFTYNYNAEPKTSFGYIFVGKSPFFAIKIDSQQSEEKTGDIKAVYSGSILYFTRSQIKDIVDAIAEENITNTMNSLINTKVFDDYEDNASNDEASKAEYEEVE